MRPYLGPYFLWLVGPVIAIAGEVTPFVARIVPALGGVLGVAIAWTIGRRWRDESLGLTLATLFAASAWAVSFQRVALSVMMLPVLTLGAVALTLRLWEAPSIRRAGSLGAVLGAAAAFHPQGLLLLPVVLVASLLHPRGRAALTPRFVGVVALGFAATSWVVWAMIPGPGGTRARDGLLRHPRDPGRGAAPLRAVARIGPRSSSTPSRARGCFTGSRGWSPSR